MRKKKKKDNIDGMTREMVMETMQTMIKMEELSEIIETYLNSDNKEENMLKIQEKIKTFEPGKTLGVDNRRTLDLILNIPDKTRSIQILYKFAKSFSSTNVMKEAYEVFLILSREYPNDMMVKQMLREFELRL